MHETVIARRIIADAEERAGGKEIRAMTVGIGEVGPVTLEELRPTLAEIANWEVTLEAIPALARCACGYAGPPRILERGHHVCVYDCPQCGGVPQITQGADIVLRSITLA